VPPAGLPREQYWNSKEEVLHVLMGAYSTLARLDGTLFKYGEMRGDMVTYGSRLDWNDYMIMNGNIYPDNWDCNWSGFYQVINYCNEVIKNAPLVKEKDHTFTDFQLKLYLSEAYYLRSLTYFYLVRVFKDVPLVLEPAETDDADFYLPKSNSDSILNQISRDLNEYRTFATIDGYRTIEENKGRATKAAFDALLADIALWRFDYEACINYVQRIEDSKKYFLLPDSKWFELFYPGNSLESIFELQYNPGLGQSNSTYGLTNRSTGTYLPSASAIEYFEAEALVQEAVRGEDASIRLNGIGNYSIWKYEGAAGDGLSARVGNEQNGCNFIIYRYADVLLMKAEALSQLGFYQDALDILNLIHERAGFPSSIIVANTPTAFEDWILHERSLEFAFEGKRWFDLLRMGRRNNFSRKTKLIEIIVQNVTSSQKRILATKLNNPNGWYLPIHKSEIERNKNLVQNPYYNSNLN
jgi:hypothetical protein